MRRPKKMTLFIIGIVLVVAAIAGASWYYAAGFARSCNPPLPRRTMIVGSTTLDVEMATTMAEQACGLSGRTGLGDGQGMLFPFGTAGAQTFWMKDMTFALDMVWIGGGKVVGVTENVPPPAPGTALWQLKLYASPSNTDTVLEVSAGTAARDGIKAGASVVLQ